MLIKQRHPSSAAAATTSLAGVGAGRRATTAPPGVGNLLIMKPPDAE
jgi:hypothetical protein